MKKIIFILLVMLCIHSYVNLATSQEVSMLSFWTEEAKKGNLNALDALGDMYFMGQYGVKKNYSKARQYYLQASEMGSPYASMALGFMYRDGKGTKKDFGRALEYLLKSGSLLALNEAGFLYSMGGPNLPKNYARSRFYYEKAAKANYAPAQVNLGMFYVSGIGIQKDFVYAKKYFESAAYQGHSPYDYYSRKATALANDKLAYLYFNGLGTPANFVKAYTSILIAIALDSENKDFLKRKNTIEKKLTNEQITIAQSEAHKIWFKMEAETEKINARMKKNAEEIQKKYQK